MKRHKLAFAEAVNLRWEHRNNHQKSMRQLGKEFNVGAGLAKSILSKSDADLLREYSDLDNPLFDEIILYYSQDGDIIFEYQNGMFRKQCATVSIYALLSTEFVPSFATLNPVSQLKLLSRALEQSGYYHGVISPIGFKHGLQARYGAIIDHKYYSWYELKQLDAVRTILAGE